MPMRRTEAGSRPAGESLSFASPKERNQRKGDPAVCAPFAALRGNLGCSVTGCTAERAARLRRSARTTAVSQFTKHARSDAHATPRPARPRRIQKGTRGSGLPHGPLLRSAPSRGRKRHALRRQGRAQRWPEGQFGCSDVLLPHPCWLRLRRGGGGGGGGGGGPRLGGGHARRGGGGRGGQAPFLRELPRGVCPRGPAQQQGESPGAPPTRPDAGLPRSEAQG